MIWLYFVGGIIEMTFRYQTGLIKESGAERREREIIAAKMLRQMRQLLSFFQDFIHLS